MSKLPALAFFFVSTGWSIPAADRSTAGEFWPEFGLYIQQGQFIRFEFVNSASRDPSAHDWQGDFTAYVNVALKPVFRRELRDRPDVYRNKYLTFRVGYRYRTGLT